MNKKDLKAVKCSSYTFDEYKRRFFPKSYPKRRPVTDPKELGRIMAEEAFEKLKPIVSELDVQI